MKRSIDMCLIAIVTFLSMNPSWGAAKPWKYQTYDKPQALFPKAALGYWDYEENENVFQVNILDYIQEYKKRDLPLTGIVIEPCWQKDYNGLKWNANYPDPATMIAKANALGISIGLWENGWLNPNCSNWQEALDNGFLLPFHKRNWVGTLREKSRQLDTRNPACIEWWMKQHESLLDMNVELFKLDAGYHEGANSLILSAPFAQKATEYTNKRIVALKCWGGWARDEEEVATGLWQGDPWPFWSECSDGVLISIINGLNGSWVFGPEIGALDGRGHAVKKGGFVCSPELYQRWVAWGMCAAHPSSMGGKSGREPWKYGPACENTFRKFAKWRMRLLPYVYSYNWNAYQTKEPLMRALAIDFPQDQNCYFDYYDTEPMKLYARQREQAHDFIETDNDKPENKIVDPHLFSAQENYEFMFGREILVAPVVWQGLRTRDVYLPAGVEWIDYEDGKTVYQGGQTLRDYPAELDEMPRFVKAGSIIPMGPDMHTVDEKPLNDLTLDIYPSKQEEASFTLYEDDGMSLDYKQGAHVITEMTCSKLSDTGLEVRIPAGKGHYDGKVTERNYTLKIHRQVKKPQCVTVNSQDIEASQQAGQGWYYNARDQIVTVFYTVTTDIDLTFHIGTSCQTTKIYTPDWESLKTHETPDWFYDGKFGIYFHWGVYSVPAYKTEWYPRYMYLDMDKGFGCDVRRHHIKTYGKDFQYHEFIPDFTAEHFDAQDWAELFKASGARYAGPAAEHSDNFSLWDSQVNPWNAARMGPKRDLVGELEEAIKAEGLKFVTTLHHHWHWGWYSTWNGLADTSTPELRQFYGETVAPEAFKNINENLEKYGPSQAFIDTWKAKVYEVIDGYQPDMLWFDGRLNIIPEKDRLEFITHFYNDAAQKGRPVVLNYKSQDIPKGAGVLDMERGRMQEIVDFPWLTDDSWTWKGWGYDPNHDYKTANHVINGLVDIVSKNGCLLLNIGPKPDGTIPQQIRTGLLEVGDWLKVNGEAIYGSRPFLVHGEGNAKLVKNHFGGVNDKGVQFGAGDVRFTTKDNSLYIIQLGTPKPEEEVLLKTFAQEGVAANVIIESIELVGSKASIDWKQTSDGLWLKAPKSIPNDIALVYRAFVQKEI